MKNGLSLNSGLNKSKQLIDDISSKLTSKKSSKKKNPFIDLDNQASNLNNNNKLSLKNNRSKAESKSEFDALLLHSNKAKLSNIIKVQKAKKAKFLDNSEIKLVEKPLSSINNLIGEVANLFNNDKTSTFQFNNKETEDNVLNLLIENISDLIEDIENRHTSETNNIVHDNLSLSDNINDKISSETEDKAELEFTNEYDILNPLNGLSTEELKSVGIENKELKVNIAQYQTKEIGGDNINYEKNNLSIQLEQNIIENPTPNKLKYSLKDLIGLIRNSINSEDAESKTHFENEVNKIILKDYSNFSKLNNLGNSTSINEGGNIAEYITARIDNLVEKNTRNLVDNFLPKYYFKGLNQLRNSDISNIKNNNNESLIQFNKLFNTSKANKNELLQGQLSDSKLDNSSFINSNISSDIINNEIDLLQSKLDSKLENKFENTINVKSNTKDEQYETTNKQNIEQSVENDAKVKRSKIDNVQFETKKEEEKLSENKKNVNKINETLISLNNNEKVENIIKRSNTLEFQSFNNVSKDDLVKTTTNAALNTSAGATSMVRITMNPNALGTVFVEIKLDGNQADINFKASDKEVISTLQEKIFELKEALGNENIEIKSLIVDYKDYSEELNKDGKSHQQNSQDKRKENQENKSLYKDLTDNIDYEINGIKLNKNFYENLKQFAGSIREESSLYKEIGNWGVNLETQKVKNKIIEKYQ